MTDAGWSSRGPDFSESYLNTARQLAKRYAIMEGVVGVALVGGLTFGEADRYSDVDLIVYLRQQSLRTWYYGEAPLPEGESRYHGLLLDVSYRDFQEEQDREWTQVEVWRASRSAVLYDPEHLLTELFERKVASGEIVQGIALDRATEIRYLLDRKVPGWLYRGEPLSAHVVVNRALNELAGLLHLINGQTEPEAGWDIALLDRLEWTPENLLANLTEALDTAELTVEAAARRRYALQRILNQCWERIAPGEPFEERADAVRQARMLREMAGLGSLSLDEWHKRYDRRLLILSPAFELLWIDRQPGDAIVRFNHERLTHLVNHDLGRFLNNQQRLLRELADRSSDDFDS